MKIKVKLLTKEELVDIFAAIEGLWEYFELSVGKKPANYDHLKETNECREDLWADVLLNGGTLVYTDHEDEDEEHEFSLSLALRRLGKPEAYQYLTKLINEDYDEYSAWMIIQLMTFGKTIYG